jgi:adenylate cyclase
MDSVEQFCLIASFAAETTAPLISLGEHALRGIATPCAVCTLPDA